MLLYWCVACAAVVRCGWWHYMWNRSVVPVSPRPSLVCRVHAVFAGWQQLPPLPAQPAGRLSLALLYMTRLNTRSTHP